MTQGKDFYGTEIAEVIEQACKELGLPQEQLDIAVLETGSTGIFGLCKKKAHIRVQIRRDAPGKEAASPSLDDMAPSAVQPEQPDKQDPAGKRQSNNRAPKRRPSKKTAPAKNVAENDSAQPPADPAETPPVAAAVDSSDIPAAEQEESASPTPENLSAIEDKLKHLLTLMGRPSAITVAFSDNTILCSISGEHEAYLASQDGKILDSLQYLLRKMIGPNLPDRATLSLDAAGYREQRLARLQEQATELAAQVRQSGKTKAISGLNPAERRAVHMALQQEAEIRSRSVGSGLFKKILIYKAGKENKPAASKRRSGTGEYQNSD